MSGILECGGIVTHSSFCREADFPFDTNDEAVHGNKEQYPDALLFFRLGDFYEMFGEDAKVAARELEITLTSREAGEARPNTHVWCALPCSAWVFRKARFQKGTEFHM